MELGLWISGAALIIGFNLLIGMAYHYYRYRQKVKESEWNETLPAATKEQVGGMSKRAPQTTTFSQPSFYDPLSKAKVLDTVDDNTGSDYSKFGEWYRSTIKK